MKSTIAEAEEGTQGASETENPTTPRVKKRKVMTDEDGMMGFGPYRMTKYGEVMRYNRNYAMYLAKAEKR